jgi:hypothetical protein
MTTVMKYSGITNCKKGQTDRTLSG